MIDEWQIRKLAEHYAQAVDRLDEQLLKTIFTPTAVLEGPGWSYCGHDDIVRILPILKDSFVTSWHAVHNHTITVTGNKASGEVYCSGRHLQKSGFAKNQVVTMIVRYQDEYVNDGDGWRISHRKELIDWTESSTIQVGYQE